MTEYLTEQEQIQQLKQLARQYVPAILIGLLLAFGASYGWQQLKNHQNHIRLQASMVYEDMLTAKIQNKPDEMITDAKTLTEKYPRTIYAAHGALMLALDAVNRGELKQAEEALKSVLKKGRNTGLYTIALIRLARVDMANGDPKAALERLDTPLDPAFNGLANMVRGEAFAAQHETEAAVKAYRLALAQLPKTGLLTTLLQMKVDNLPTGMRT